ncbi:hypothetical protein NMY22_g11730 [Coprinellus aureogranulatus]|nr:hypothetical protein NMY22_g11730 [Coprinellus aureogranulatus]
MSASPDDDRYPWGVDFLALLSHIRKAFIWTLDENDTVVMLVAALRAPCWIYATIVLYRLNLLDERCIDLNRGGLGMCLDTLDEGSAHFRMHRLFRELLRRGTDKVAASADVDTD